MSITFNISYFRVLISNIFFYKNMGRILTVKRVDEKHYPCQMRNHETLRSRGCPLITAWNLSPCCVRDDITKMTNEDNNCMERHANLVGQDFLNASNTAINAISWYVLNCTSNTIRTYNRSNIFRHLQTEKLSSLESSSS